MKLPRSILTIAVVLAFVIGLIVFAVALDAGTTASAASSPPPAAQQHSACGTLFSGWLHNQSVNYCQNCRIHVYDHDTNTVATVYTNSSGYWDFAPDHGGKWTVIYDLYDGLDRYGTGSGDRRWQPGYHHFNVDCGTNYFSSSVFQDANGL